MGTMKGGEVLAQALAALGVREVFALHGGHMDAFLVACPAAGIRLTDVRHEATAGYAAEAYARAAGTVGVCAVTAGPGFTNVLTAIADAWLDAAPVLFITSSSPLREVETNPLQGGFDQIAMAAPVTKWAHRVTDVERIPDLVDKAIRLAISGRPGPVLLEVPIDVMFNLVPASQIVMPTRHTLTTAPAPSPEAVAIILDMLTTAERPAIIVGGGAANARCASLLAQFVELVGVPVVSSAKGVGVLPPSHKWYAGPAATLAQASAMAGQAPDLVIQLGARAGMFLGGRGGAIIPHEARLVQVDINGAEIGRLRAPDLAVVADCAETVAALLTAASEHGWAARDGWAATLRDCRARAMATFMDEPLHTGPGLLHPFHAVRGVMEALSPDTAFAFDGGEIGSWFLPFGRAPGPGLLTGNGYLSALGVGQGYGIGLARARPDRPVALIMGDGAVGFHIAEFDAFARHGLPIVTIIFNNAAWGISRHGQELLFGKQNTQAVDLARSAYHEVARGLGCRGEQITRFEDIGPAVRMAQQSGLPTCLNIMTDGEIAHPNVARMIGKLDAPDEIPIPYYENIPIRA